ncbi:MAG: ACT domain-containing protein, partial [Candidatus Lokiarchaeota archaeon]|nr:ACT domain-containing protein [Candidatus Lokiarchaeota archaeon]
NIRALTVAETADYGILRIIVNNPDKCIDILRDSNYLVSETDVLAFEVEDKPGGLHNVATLMGDNGINIEYLYSTLTSKTAIILMRVNDIDKAEKLLNKEGIQVFKGDEVYSI